jgi:hypothetical protein
MSDYHLDLYARIFSGLSGGLGQLNQASGDKSDVSQLVLTRTTNNYLQTLNGDRQKLTYNIF